MNLDHDVNQDLNHTAVVVQHPSAYSRPLNTENHGIHSLQVSANDNF